MQEKIILGFGNNLDYEVVYNPEVFEHWITRYGIHPDELSTDIEIHSERDFVVSILSFMRSESGGERFVSSPELIERFAQHFEKRITLGGTAGRAAIAMRKLGYTSALHLVTINDAIRGLLPEDCTTLCSNTKDSSYPHLILQYGKDTHVNAGDIQFCTRRANRIIYLNDADNMRMKLNEDFSRLITEAKVFLISGFNAMQSRDLLVARLETLLRMMEKRPRDAWLFYEDACFYDPGFSRLIYSTLADRIHIYSLNEDELQAYLGRKLDLRNAFQIQEALEEIQNIIPAPWIVIHCMYWALAYGENAARLAKALKGGVTMATTRFRFGDDFTVEDYKETEGLPPREEGVRFAGALSQLLGEKVCCVPVVQVEESNATTVGLGDAFVGGFLPALLP